MRIQLLHKKHSQGFTLVEVAVVVPVLILVAISMFNILWSILTTSNYERDRLNAIHDKQSAIDIIESDIAFTSRFLATTSAGISDPYLPTSNGGVWSYKGDSSTSRFLLLRTYSTTNNPLGNDRQPVFIGSGTACDPANLYFNEVQRYNTIYFVKNGNLYRRKLVNTSTATCSVQYQKTSCPSAVDLGASQNASCGADDELILTNVSNFTVNYYASRTASTPVDAYQVGADSSLVTSATDAEITLAVTKQVAGKSLTTQTILRITKLNTDL